MDYRGQKWTELLYYIIVILFGTVAWIIGYFERDFFTAFYGWAIGLGLSLVVCIPDWPFYNLNKVEWLAEIPDRTEVKAAPAAKPKAKKTQKSK
mmetsp:Transcript_27148/g.27388  ORF Transcript_27148/g.27388 Transcript_27148/m.27388 type:complete len:94 (+) Transcript_27148:124-405(+)